MSTTEKIKALVAKGEGLNVEFKTAREELPRNVYETICAFLNRKGGHILLGVKDNGYVEGINADMAQKQLRTLANDMNNPQIISPTSRLETDVVQIEGKTIICIHVPESPQAHSFKGVYYDRHEDGDYQLTNSHLIATLYIRKQDGYTENKVFPHLQMKDFVQESFDQVRTLVAVRTNGAHPWVNMGNEEILRSAKLYRYDENTGKEGYTLAAALLFGTEITIGTACPHYRIDALCRKEDVDRYDDREVIACNLLQAYSRLMAFIQKHTPDRFFLEGIQRVSVRDIIFREMVANLLIHREYSSHHRASLTIYKETVVTENGSIPYVMGRITPANLKPHPKNPNIADFFRQLEWVEDLGSGVRKMFHYCPLYVKDENALPLMEEGDVFRLTVRYEKESVPPTEKLNTAISIKHAAGVLALIRKNPKITAHEIAQNLAVTKRTVERVISNLVAEKLIERQGSKKVGEWIIVDAQN
ncbi:MAG: putative DNA binding domain-containing protein [Prevotellaceae bacterium]|jgi:ATP-dependent DNA helicase RecG|nr:putative DNA binding domain-containing protein [Prevotellaceae bacterium]